MIIKKKKVFDNRKLDLFFICYKRMKKKIFFKSEFHS